MPDMTDYHSAAPCKSKLLNQCSSVHYSTISGAHACLCICAVDGHSVTLENKDR